MENRQIGEKAIRWLTRNTGIFYTTTGDIGRILRNMIHDSTYDPTGIKYKETNREIEIEGVRHGYESPNRVRDRILYKKRD